MRTTAVFVDAGYYFAAASELKCGKPVARSKVQCDHGALVRALCEWAKGQLEDEPVRLLRCYWYDGGRDGIPTSEHLGIAKLPDVKLRLGRQTSSGQKGVDGLIILDLTTLARDGGLDTAFLISGDEDLREACLAAQQMGVRVVLVGIPPGSQAFNQSESLVREADEHHVLPEEFWTHPLTVVAGETAPVFQGSGPALEDEHPLLPMVVAFVGTVRKQLGPERAAALVDQRPALPKYVDQQLLHDASSRQPLDEGLKRRLRTSFWRQWDLSSG